MIDRLLDALSIILSGHSYKPLGAPPSILRADSGTASKEPVPPEVANAVKGPELLTLALTTLHTFDFSGESLLSETYASPSLDRESQATY